MISFRCQLCCAVVLSSYSCSVAFLLVQGFIVPNIDFSGICHSQFKPGPPSEEAQCVSQFILDVITNSKLLDPKDLVIVEGKLVWVVYIDLVTFLSYAITPRLEHDRKPRSRLFVR